jgi:hypothetical protein
MDNFLTVTCPSFKDKKVLLTREADKKNSWTLIDSVPRIVTLISARAIAHTISCTCTLACAYRFSCQPKHKPKMLF